jgi:hypothetical protein
MILSSRLSRSYLAFRIEFKNQLLVPASDPFAGAMGWEDELADLAARMPHRELRTRLAITGSFAKTRRFCRLYQEFLQASRSIFQAYQGGSTCGLTWEGRDVPSLALPPGDLGRRMPIHRAGPLAILRPANNGGA